MGELVENVFYRKQTATIRRLASDPECILRWTTAAVEELAVSHGLTGEDIREFMTSCHVISEEKTEHEDLWMVEGMDIDGTKIRAVVVAYEFEITIKLVGAF
jgi:hypothetical protein